MITFEASQDAIPLQCIKKGDFDEWIKTQSKQIQNLTKLKGFTASANQYLEILNTDGELERLIAGLGSSPQLSSIALLPLRLPANSFQLLDAPEDQTYELLLGWALGSYQFSRYKNSKPTATLHMPNNSFESVLDEYQAISLVRDLINTPASDMLPHHLEVEVREIANRHSANLAVTMDKELLKKGYRTIFTVGQASASEPRLLDLRWGNPEYPKVTIVGKGVCFDSGGLDIKPGSAMRSMKKDMGGAANALGLADLIMRRELKVNLRLLIPAVENAISGNAYRPGDVIQTYQGLTVEIGNTDAEGRLIMCDALSLACEEKPDLLIDFSTLTGAARSAVGTEIAAMFSNSDEVADGICQASSSVNDPVCRLPLYSGYRSGLNSPIADLCNIASFPQGGAITAALFLQEFVHDTNWVHYDINAYNDRARPAHPVGGEAMGMRATFKYIQDSIAS